jgi:drug/metabolite transporter (DMT)-like permease
MTGEKLHDAKLPAGMIGALCVAVSILLWGMNSVVMRMGVRHGLTAGDMTALRYCAAALALVPFASRRAHFPVGGIGWGRAFVLFVLAGVPYNMACVVGAGFAPALDISAIVFGVLPIATAILAYFVAGERLTATRARGLALVLAGILPFTLQAVWDGINSGSEAWKGHVLFAVAGCMWAAFTALSKRWQFNPWEVTAAVSILSALSTPLWYRTSVAHIESLGIPWLGFFALYTGILVSVVSLMSFQKAVRLLGPTMCGMAIALVPFVTWVGGEIMLGETPTLSALGGMVLVIAGLAVASRASAPASSAMPEQSAKAA